MATRTFILLSVALAVTNVVVNGAEIDPFDEYVFIAKLQMIAIFFNFGMHMICSHLRSPYTCPLSPPKLLYILLSNIYIIT
jgi:hypothetical protein